MPAPRHIVDSLECVISIFFSSARHHVRAAFILCDELVEVTCRECARQAQPNLGRTGFFQLLQHPAVSLDPATSALGASLYGSHTTRNDMHHANAAATVDAQHCADGILDAVHAMEHCFPGSSGALPDRVTVALRIIRLISTPGAYIQLDAFTKLMQQNQWRRVQGRAKVTEVIISPGARENWGFILFRETAAISAMLDSVGAPP